jgi:hypothetical protein
MRAMIIAFMSHITPFYSPGLLYIYPVFIQLGHPLRKVFASNSASSEFEPRWRTPGLLLPNKGVAGGLTQALFFCALNVVCWKRPVEDGVPLRYGRKVLGQRQPQDGQRR